MPPDTPSRLFLIDGSGYLYRAFYAVRHLSRRDGFPTNAIFGFIKMLRKVVDEQNPDHLAMIFDAKGPNFRHDLDPDYKANRKPMPDELRCQVPIIHEAVAAYNIPCFELSGYEADDLIGTLATAGAQSGLEVVIVTGDKDMMQLVSPAISIFDSGRDGWVRAPEVAEKWGVEPERVTQVMALAGDTSDNIPGVPGIGEKTAAQLIREYGDLETLLTSVERIKQPARRKKLTEFADQARLAHRLVTIDRNVPLDYTLEGLRRRPPDREKLHALFVAMEFTSLAREMAAPAPLPGLEAAPATLPGTTATAEQPTPSAGQSEPVNDYRTLISEASFGLFLAELQARPAFSLDTETTGTDPVQAELVGLSFAWRPRQAFYIPVAHTAEAAPRGQLDREWVLARLKPILENPAVAKTGQNIKYEYVVLRKYGIRLQGIARDAMLYSHLLYGSGRRHNLDAIAMEELQRTTTTFKEVAGVGKKQLRFDQVPLERAGPYACEDAEVAWEAAEGMERSLAAMAPVARLYAEVEKPLIPVLGEMELAGALLDRAALAAMSERFTERRGELVEAIHALAGEAFNVNSTQQLGEILFNKLGIKGGKKTKTGFSTDAGVLEKLADQGHELPARVLDYRILTKLQSTYTDALQDLINPATGRVHTSFNQAVTLTGRLSSSEPNLQNIPIRREEGRAIRGAFIAPPGWRLLCADYSQIELRLLAHMGQVPRLIEAFSRDLDIHAATAAELFGGDVARVGEEQRRMAKTINFGLVYGMSPYGLAKRLGIGNNEARDYMEVYFSRYRGVREHMERVKEQARLHGHVETIGGRRCFVRDIGNSNRTLRELAERTAINAPLQGSAADLIKMAMIRLQAALEAGGFRSRMILQVHDELVLEVPEAELERLQPVVREAMEGAMRLSVPLKVDMGIGSSWAEAH